MPESPESIVIVAFGPNTKSILMKLKMEPIPLRMEDVSYWSNQLPIATPGHDFIITTDRSKLAFPEDHACFPHRFVCAHYDDTMDEVKHFFTMGLTGSIPTGSVVFCLVGSDEHPASENDLEVAASFIPKADKARFNIVMCHHQVELYASSARLSDEMVAQAMAEKAFVGRQGE